MCKRSGCRCTKDVRTTKSDGFWKEWRKRDDHLVQRKTQSISIQHIEPYSLCDPFYANASDNSKRSRFTCRYVGFTLFWVIFWLAILFSLSHLLHSIIYFHLRFSRKVKSVNWKVPLVSRKKESIPLSKWNNIIFIIFEILMKWQWKIER